MTQGPYFDANQFTPSQISGGGKHPVGKFPAEITDTDVAPTSSKSGNMYVVTFKTPVGEIDMRFNLWNSNPEAVRISQEQLSFLCHVTGIYRLNFETKGAELRGAQLMIEVGEQKAKPEYTEVKKLFDRFGNEPGKGNNNNAGQQGGQQQQNNNNNFNQNAGQPPNNNSGGGQQPWTPNGGGQQADNNGAGGGNNGGAAPWGGAGGGGSGQPSNAGGGAGSPAPWAR
jgi:hypothetical protein